MNLDERKQKILKAVVHEHVRTAEPVASEQIAVACKLGVKSATIRNEMAEMADLGYLRQPHTSSGRVPSDRGYRFYVDYLMPHSSLNPSHLKRGEAVLVREHSAVDDLVAGTCRLLSAITELTAVATAPTAEALTLKWLDLRQVASDKVMLWTLWSNGQLRHAILTCGRVSADVLRLAGRRLAERVTGATEDELRLGLKEAATGHDAPIARMVSVALQMVQEIAADVSEPEVFIDGASYFARHPEFHEHETMELVLSVLEQHATVASLLRAAAVGERPQVVIGTENPLEPLRACSLVAASYGDRSGIGGSIGVCGPTRMDYAHVIAAIEVIARNLSSALASTLPA
ncbi:MAG: heat-inducible transcription repressor HrcA [Armatimonadetes bacterium]|nr:heat-inducible transcription repressor HrcA [Armatimonadota bacterium]